MGISFNGLASGLDTTSWVDSLVALKKAKITTLEEKKESIVSMQETLNNIKSFFSSFRSMLEKVTDAKFGIPQMDLFAQNLAISSNINLVTGTATTEADEAEYKINVNKLATETQAASAYSTSTTIVKTTTATLNSKLTDIGVKISDSGSLIGVTSNGAEYKLTLNKEDTIQGFIQKLQDIGVEAGYNNQTGVFTAKLNKNDINDIDNTGIVDALHLESVNAGYTSNTLYVSKTSSSETAANENTLLSDLGVRNGVFTVLYNGAEYDFTVEDGDTLGDIIAAFETNGIKSAISLKDGVLTLTNAEITSAGTTDIINALELRKDVASNEQISGDLSSSGKVTTFVTATESTKLEDVSSVFASNPKGFLEEVTQMSEEDAEAAGYTCVHDAEELELALLDGSSKIILMNDIDMSGVRWDNYNLENQIFDGNGFSIKNYTGSNSLFYEINNSEVRNLKLENTELSIQNNSIGVLVGEVHSSTIENIIIDAKLDATDYHNGSAGLLAGKISDNSQINSCAVYGDIDAMSCDGSMEIQPIVGYINNSTVNNSFGAVTISASVQSELAGTSIGNQYAADPANFNGKLISVFSKYNEFVGNINLDENATIGDLLTALGEYGIQGQINDGVITLNSTNGNYIIGEIAEELGISKTEKSITYTNECSSNKIIYNETIVASGTTTMEELKIATNGLLKYVKQLNSPEINNSAYSDYIQVSTAEELNDILHNDLNAKVILTRDIDLSGIDWNPVGTTSAAFQGEIQGNGHTISNVKVKTNTTANGFFGVLNGKVENLKLTNVQIDTNASGYSGALAGKAEGGIITNCYVDGYVACSAQGNIVSDNVFAGGLLGYAMSADVTDTISKATVVAPYANAAGFVAQIQGGTNLNNCIAAGDIGDFTGDGSYICGFSYSVSSDASLTNCYDASNINDSDWYDWSFVGEDATNISGMTGLYIRQDRKCTPGYMTEFSTVSFKGINGIGSELAVLDRAGNLIAEMDLNELSTIDDIFAWLKEYGINCSIEYDTGNISLLSENGNVVSGIAAAELGIQLNAAAARTTIGLSTTSSAAIQATEEIAVNGNTTLRQIMQPKINGVMTESGIEGSVIAISTIEDLKNLETLVNRRYNMEGKTFVLTNNIDMGGQSLCIGGYNREFSGTFDGQGYTIYNIDISPSEDFQARGLFGIVKNAVIKNLNIDGIHAESSVNGGTLGGIAGEAFNSEISNINIKNLYLKIPKVESIGGILGSTVTDKQVCNVTIKGCTTSGTIISDQSMGGIMGYANSDTYISQCVSDIEFYNSDGSDDKNGQHMAGGIVSYFYYNSTMSSTTGVITDCIAKGNASNLVRALSMNNSGQGHDWDAYHSGLIINNSCLIARQEETDYATSLVREQYFESDDGSNFLKVNNSFIFEPNNSMTPAIKEAGNGTGNVIGSLDVSYTDWNTAYNNTMKNWDPRLWKFNANNAPELCPDSDFALKVLDKQGNLQEYYKYNGDTSLASIENTTGLLKLDGDRLVYKNEADRHTKILSGNIADRLGFSYAREYLCANLDSTGTLMNGTDGTVATADTKFADLGPINDPSTEYYEDGWYNSIKIVSGGEIHTISVNETMTVGEFLDTLTLEGLSASITDGVVKIENTADAYIISDSIDDPLANIYKADLQAPLAPGNTIAKPSPTWPVISVFEALNLEETSSSTIQYTQQDSEVIHAYDITTLDNTNAALGDITSYYDSQDGYNTCTIVSNGICSTITVTSTTTIDSFMQQLTDKGFSCSLNDNKITIEGNDNCYIYTMDAGLRSAVKISRGYSTSFYEHTNTDGNKNNEIVHENVTMTENTKLEDLGYKYNISDPQYLYIWHKDSDPAGDPDESIEIVQDKESDILPTVAGLIQEFKNFGINARIEDGKLIVDRSDVNWKFSDGLSAIFGGIGQENPTTETTYANTASNKLGKETISELSEDTLLSNLGVTEGEFYIYNNGVQCKVMITSDETVGSFINRLKSFGLSAEIINDENGSRIKVSGAGNSYIATSPASNASNVVDKLFGGNKKSTYNYSAELTVSGGDTKNVLADENTLIGDIGDSWGESVAGKLSVTVNGETLTINIHNDETIGDLLDKFRNLGIEASISNGQIILQSGFNTFSINSEGSTSSLANPHANTGLIFNSDFGGYVASSEEVMAETTEIINKNLSAANYADLSTQLKDLNISSGSLSIYRDGEKALIQINSENSFADIRAKISAAFSDVELDFDNGHLTIYSKNGADIRISSNTDTSNFASITGITTDDSGKAISSRELFKVYDSSILTDAGLFRMGTVSEGTFIIGDAEFTIDNKTTMQNLISQINSSEKSNATAYWDNITGTLNIKSRTTGSAIINIEAGTSNFTDILGFTKTVTNEDNSITKKLDTSRQTLGSNARFSINGINYTAVSNTVTSDVTKIKGLTINLKGLTEDSTVTLTVERDKETLANTVSDVVTSYNELMENVDKAIAIEGELHGETVLKSIRNRLKTLMTGASTASTVFRNLDSIGISVDKASAGNISTSNDRIVSLTFDKDKFIKAFEQDQKEVKSLLVDENLGIFNKVEELVESALKSVSGYFDTTSSSLAKKASNLETKIVKGNLAIEKYRQRLESKFSAMDLMIGKIQQQYSSFLGLS